MAQIKYWREKNRTYLKDVIPLDTHYNIGIEVSSLCNARCVYCAHSKHNLGAATGTSHAMGLAALYPAWIKEEYRACQDEVMDVFRCLLNRTPRSAQEAEEQMANFLMELGLCVSLKELGVKEGEIDVMVEKISGDISVDPAGGEDGLYIAAM